MDALAGPLAAAAALLVAGGAPKVVAPGDTTRALRQLRLPATRTLVRVAGAAEIATGVAVLAGAGPVATGLLGAWYAVFTAVVVLALRSGAPLATCGCFGGQDTPPTRTHALLVAAASVTAVAATVQSVTVEVETGRDLVVLALAGLTAWFGYLVMSRLAVLSQAGAR
jgi:hypothetical protein